MERYDNTTTNSRSLIFVKKYLSLARGEREREKEKIFFEIKDSAKIVISSS